MVIAANLSVSPANTFPLGIAWEEVPCPLCRHDRWTAVIEAADTDPGSSPLRFGVVRCVRCGLQFTNPRPTFESMARFYPPGYAPHRSADLVRKPQRRWYPSARFLGRPCPERRALPWLGRGRLFDFGCGGGEYLCRMRERGWKVTGMDASLDLVRALRERLGLEVYGGTLPHPKLPPAGFDVVTMWSSLEHVHQPLETLRAAYRLLAPGGKIYLTVPNIDSWPYHWFGPNWFGLELPRHLTHLTPTTLRTMLEIAGFHIESMRMVSHPQWLHRSAQTAIRARRANLAHHLFRSKTFARLAAWVCFRAGRSDCIAAVAERPG